MAIMTSAFDLKRALKGVAMVGWHITENDIKNWTATDKRRSEEILPQLIYKLILASCSPKKNRFPLWRRCIYRRLGWRAGS